MPGSDAPADVLVVCLCAAWCGVCRDWRATFEEAAAAHPQAQFAWVDIEDEAEAMDDVDIETFPTLLIAVGGSVRFLGPVQPTASQVARLVAQAAAGVQAQPHPSQALFARLSGGAIARGRISR